MTTDYVALFDLDGTLVNTEARSRAAWTMLFEAHGAYLDGAILSSFSGRRSQEVLFEHLHLFRGESVPDLYAEVSRYYSSAAVPPVTPVSGAVQLVQSLYAARVPMAVVSSGMRRTVEATLHEFALLEMMDLVVTAEDVKEGKPHPDGYLRACRQLRIPPECSVVFEDAPAGVTAAKAAHARCIGITTTHTSAALRHADLVVPDLTGISWPPTFDADVVDQSETT